MSVEETIKRLRSHYKWMIITKHGESYMLEDTRFAPCSLWKGGLSESELLEELKWHIKGMDE